MRARLTQGSNQATSTKRAPALYAASATARVRYSLPGSLETDTTWSGWTLAPTWTARSASLLTLPFSTAASLLADSGVPGAVDGGLDAVRPRLPVTDQHRL